MLDGLWHVFDINYEYIGYFETSIGEGQLIVSSNVWKNMKIGTTLLLLGNYDNNSREVKVTAKTIGAASGRNILGIQIVHDKIAAEEQAKLVIPARRPRSLWQKIFGNL